MAEPNTITNMLANQAVNTRKNTSGFGLQPDLASSQTLSFQFVAALAQKHGPTSGHETLSLTQQVSWLQLHSPEQTVFVNTIPIIRKVKAIAQEQSMRTEKEISHTFFASIYHSEVLFVDFQLHALDIQQVAYLLPKNTTSHTNANCFWCDTKVLGSRTNSAIVVHLCNR